MPPRARLTIERMAGYTPGEQPAPGDKVIKLNTNESPHPPSPRVMEAIRAVDAEQLRRYPNPTADRFRAAAAAVHGVSVDQVIAGNGSDDILAIAVRTFVGPGEAFAWPDPTYSLYPVLGDIGEARAVTVPWLPGWRLPADALAATGARALFFANPNAPSGTLVPPAEVRALARRYDGVVLVDEAYIDFADPAGDGGDGDGNGDNDCLGLIADCPNVIVSRTLSKGYGLAGLRLGYAVASPALITQMMKVKDSYNCDALSVAAGAAALADRGYARRVWDEVRAERARLTAALTRRGFTVIPSQANFLLAAVPGGDGGALYRALKARGVLVRFFDKPGLADKVRITIGRRDENDALLAALDDGCSGAKTEL
jgi:histidinol-phosphate aminotransferase